MVTLLYAALLGIMLVVLSAMVIFKRLRFRISLGLGNNIEMERAVRAHGNFVEYVPYAIFLIFLSEYSGAQAWFVHLLGIALVAGRLLHAAGIHGQVNILRSSGMLMTFAVLLTASATCLYYFLWK